MEYKRFGAKMIVRLDKGEEIVETLKSLCQKEKINLGSVICIGATNKAEIGWFETGTKEYHGTELTGDYEIAPICGNITTLNGEVYLHLHANLGNTQYEAKAGHLKSAVVSATCEAVIDIIEGHLPAGEVGVDRGLSSEIGLNLLKFK